MMKIKRTDIVIVATINFSLIVLITFLWLTSLRRQDNTVVAKHNLVSQLHLTDLCLSTESRHTRHLSQPEWIAPFQDVPGYHDHFPSSTFFRPHQP